MTLGAIFGVGCLLACAAGVAYLMMTAPPMPPGDLPEPPAPVYQPQLTAALTAVDERMQRAFDRLHDVDKRLAELESSQGRADRARVECAAKLAEAALALEGLDQVAIEAVGEVSEKA